MGKHFHPAHRMSNFLEQHHRRHRYAPMPMRGMSMLPDIALWRLFFYWAKSLPMKMKREQRWLNHNPHHRASDCCARMPVRQCLPPSQLSNTFRGIFRIIAACCYGKHCGNPSWCSFRSRKEEEDCVGDGLVARLTLREASFYFSYDQSQYLSREMRESGRPQSVDCWLS